MNSIGQVLEVHIILQNQGPILTTFFLLFFGLSGYLYWTKLNLSLHRKVWVKLSLTKMNKYLKLESKTSD